jgi:hypothetical protein
MYGQQRLKFLRVVAGRNAVRRLENKKNNQAEQSRAEQLHYVNNIYL